MIVDLQIGTILVIQQDEGDPMTALGEYSRQMKETAVGARNEVFALRTAFAQKQEFHFIENCLAFAYKLLSSRTIQNPCTQ
jgi:hypothetical protein